MEGGGRVDRSREARAEGTTVITGKGPPVAPLAIVDTSATENILGLGNYIKWQDTVLDTIDDLLRAEKELAAAAAQ